MFTGVITEVGRIGEIRRLPAKSGDAFTRVAIAGRSILSNLKIGDSVAVSGVCLTAVEIGDTWFSADLAQETLERTSLGRLQTGSLVNLELPARAQDRMGGHVVQGHVDGISHLLRLKKIEGGEDWRLRIELGSALRKYVVPQGSITVEGISLTVAAISGSRVEVAIIPHTYEATNLHALPVGAPLNIEVDVLAKYAEKMAQAQAPGRLSVAELIKQGF